MRAVFPLIRILYCSIAIICLFGPICYVLLRGKFRNSVFLIWGLWFLFFLSNAIFVYYLVAFNYDEDGEPGFALFATVLVGVLGWIPALIISSFAVVLRNAVICFWRHVFSDSNNKDKL
jgi:fatty acid desaturase